MKDELHHFRLAGYYDQKVYTPMVEITTWIMELSP
jgi:hypothetical protein